MNRIDGGAGRRGRKLGKRENRKGEMAHEVHNPAHSRRTEKELSSLKRKVTQLSITFKESNKITPGFLNSTLDYT